MGKVFFWILLLGAFALSGQSILIDEDLSDWNNPAITEYEEVGDNSRLDIMSLAITDDSEFLYFKIEFDKEILLQQDNNLTLEISNSQMDFEFNFGNREGRFENLEIFHENINLISSPTVSSRIFEVQISKTWNLGFGSEYRLEGAYEFSLSNRDSNSDQLPNGNEKITYILSTDPSPSIPAYSLAKNADADFRFCSYNVFRDNIFESDARSAYSALLKTIDPDVLIFQEIYDHTSSQTLTRLLNVFNALDASATWHSSDRGSDNIILSKYPIIYSREIAGNGVFVIDKEGIEIMIVNVHLPCCERDSEREVQIDRILSFIRRSKAGEENFTLKKNSPIIISGDTNFVGNSDQVDALISGNIFNNSSNGPDYEIDWDTDGLADLKPFTSGRNSMYTWVSNFSSYSAGRLDYVFYSDHSLQALNSFVLDTKALSDTELSEWNLKKEYSGVASDHLPVIADFKFTSIVPTEEISELSLQVWPNPAANMLHIDPQLFVQNTTFHLYNYQGQLVSKIGSPNFDLTGISEGIYYIIGKVGKQTQSYKLAIIR